MLTALGHDTPFGTLSQHLSVTVSVWKSMIYPPLKISGAVGGEAGGRDGGAGGGDERGSDGIIPCNFKDLEWV